MPLAIPGQHGQQPAGRLPTLDSARNGNRGSGRKPYVDAAVRELTSGDTRSQEQLRQKIERMMIAAGTSNPDVRHTTRRPRAGQAWSAGAEPAEAAAPALAQGRSSISF